MHKGFKAITLHLCLSTKKITFLFFGPHMRAHRICHHFSEERQASSADQDPALSLVIACFNIEASYLAFIYFQIYWFLP